MGYEVELKFRVADPADLARRLLKRAEAADVPVDHEDTYYAHPSRDFARTGEAFRIRREGGANRVTYKGARHPGPTKTREEIEVEFESGAEPHADLGRLLDRLGFSPVLAVRKRRTSYHLTVAGRALTVTVDRAEGLGDFAEVETLVADDGDLAAGQVAVRELAAELKLLDEEPRSYLRMLLEASGRIGQDPAGQT